MMKIFLALALLAAPAFGDHWISEQEVSKWSAKTDTLATDYHEECSVLTSPSSFPGFMNRVAGFRNQVRNFKQSLYRGYNYCVPSFRQLRDNFKSLKQEFESNYANHPNFRVRLGWQRVELAFLETVWAFTQGEDL